MAFEISLVTDERNLRETYRLRYRVYCEEWGFERPDDHPDQIETDVYDANSLHFAARDSSGRTVGTVRLILYSQEGFPIEKYCQLEIDPDDLPRHSLSEISRVAISKQYRRRTEDQYIYGPDEDRRSIGSFEFDDVPSFQRGLRKGQRATAPLLQKQERRFADRQGDRRRRHEPVISLYRELYKETKRRKISHWYAVMTKGLLILIRRYFGYQFREIGDPVDYHGIRTPYLGVVDDFDRALKKKNPALYEEFNYGL